MNPVIDKILKNILDLSGGKFVYLLKIEENKHSVLSVCGELKDQNGLIEEFNEELAKINKFSIE
ncbi:MAG: hypothetical protein F9K45_07280, partial [Melioribacteraceae bacterium]